MRIKGIVGLLLSALIIGGGSALAKPSFAALMMLKRLLPSKWFEKRMLPLECPTSLDLPSGALQR
jgi:hypothetical protein